MSKDTPWFKFGTQDWLSGSIQFLPLQHKGLFIDLCALYWESQQPLEIDTKLAVRTRLPKEELTALVVELSDLEVVFFSEAKITIPFLDRLMSDRKRIIENCAKGGRKSSGLKQSRSNKSIDIRDKKEDNRNKNKTKPQIHDEAIASVVFPEYFTEELKQLFYDFAGSRRDDKKYMTSRAITAHFNQLDGFNALEIAESYNKAVASGWQSVNPKHDPNLKEPQHDPDAKAWDIEDRAPTLQELIDDQGIDTVRGIYSHLFNADGTIKEQG